MYAENNMSERERLLKNFEESKVRLTETQQSLKYLIFFLMGFLTAICAYIFGYYLGGKQ